MNVLFITRKFPPMKGGMEKVAYELYKHLSEITDVKLIKWGGMQKFLPIILPYFLLKSYWILLTKKIDVIYLQDGLLAPIGIILRMFGKPVVITIHGLDVTYSNKIYQFLAPMSIKHLDKIICISRATKQECINRGIPEEKITIISDGISDEFYTKQEDKNKLRSELESKLKTVLTNKKIILSVGRLVERKGFHWFVENVVPKLLGERKDIMYLIVGGGAYNEKIKKNIDKNNLENYVFMLGKVDDETLKLLYNSVDVFVMPNIHIEGDMEGFGVVALEAASCGVPVVASDLEGIRDAVKNGENGFLVKPYDVDGIIETINELLENNKESEKFGRRAREFSLENFRWEKIAEEYFDVFEKANRG